MSTVPALASRNSIANSETPAINGCGVVCARRALRDAIGVIHTSQHGCDMTQKSCQILKKRDEHCATAEIDVRNGAQHSSVFGSFPHFLGNPWATGNYSQE